MTTFYVVRHGNTELNYKGVLMGHIDSPLTDQGYNDAFFLAKKLKKIKFNAIFSSDLGRAFITAHIIADAFGLTNSIFRDKALREIDFGDLTGKIREEVRGSYDKIKSNARNMAPGGESYLDVKKRIVNNLLGLSKKSYKNILMVTHAGCIRVIIAEALNKKLDELLKREISHRFIGKFDIKNGKIRNFKIVNE